MSHPSIPNATYRFQFRKEFTFRQAQELVSYLKDLGISHCYASPFFQATPGSTHGYDISNHNAINPEVGTREEFDSFSQSLRDAGLGLLVDFVPNHMGIAEAGNLWWMDVLEHGPASPHAPYFDIDWQPLKRELERKVLLPILGDHYGRILARGELKLAYADGVFTLRYFDTVLPIEPGSTRSILQRAATLAGDALAEEDRLEVESILTGLEHLPSCRKTTPEKIAERSREQLVLKRRLKALTEKSSALGESIVAAMSAMQEAGADPATGLEALLAQQNYRLSFWRVAGEEINYRRFFDINTLAAIRMELPEVFANTHKLIFELIAAGAVQGLRIDHVDGLYYPRLYLEQLQQEYGRLMGLAPEERGLYLVVEKILGPDEKLRADWPAHGTTGYEFANQVLGVLVDPAAEKEFTETYRRFVPDAEPYHELVYASKLLVMRSAMASEINTLGHRLNRISESNPWYRDFTLNALTAAVREMIACFPVYRTYIAPDGTASEEDRKVIDRAINAARRRNPASERTVFTFLREVLLPPAENPHPIDEEARREFVLKLQQCSGPITAKGVEDTSFYIYNRLVALNEVGGEPGIFGSTVEKFHAQNVARLEQVPHSQLTTSTHDTKRSEDVRARVAALSEIPQVWAQAVKRWQTANRKHKKTVDGSEAPSANEEYMLYQNLIGSWPLEWMEQEPADGSPAHTEYVQRIQEYMTKALHEAKVNSSWIEPNQAWDQAVGDFVAAILSSAKANRFIRGFIPLAAQVAQLGAINSLSQLVLKMTVPGVPDFYQGNEIWDWSLVDPDNRRPVDYVKRREMLAQLGERPVARELLDHWTDGRIKLFVTRETLRLRGELAELFRTGSYQPVTAQGKFASHLVAFRRLHEGQEVLVCVPRLSGALGFPPLGEKWEDTALETDGAWENIFTHAEIAGSSLPLRDVLSEFPVAILRRKQS